jgi:hypothetical protein
MRKSSIFMAGMSAVLLAFGLVLAGCDNGTTGGGDNDGGDNVPTIPSGTITLAGTDEENTFTMTLSEGLVWYDVDSLSAFFFELDGEVTAPGPDASNAAISSAGEFNYSFAKISDTVVTVELSQFLRDRYYFGSGKLKLRDMSSIMENRTTDYGSWLISHFTTQGDAYMNTISSPWPMEDTVVAAHGKLTTEGGSVNFNIPKHEE